MQLPKWLIPASRVRKVLTGKDFYLRRDVRLNHITLGNPHACWTICPDLLNEKSIIYSFGVGSDISFDVSLIEKFGLQVHAFDPTPDSISWIDSHDLPKRFRFHPLGLSSYDGDAKFYAPSAHGAGSHSLLTNVYKTDPVSVTVNRLQTIMQQLGHNQIDLLKLDIEGAEYAVLEDIIQNNLPIKQLLVEFHHRFKGVGIAKSLQAVSMLHQSGYKIFHVSPLGEEVSFIHEKNPSIPI